MLLLRAAVLAAVSAVVVSAASAAPPPAPKRELRAATVDELPPEAKAALAAPSRPAATTSTSGAEAQQAHIDPRTGALIEAPPGSATVASGTGEAVPQVDMSLQRFPNGFLYIDTSGYQHSATATVDADGNVHLQCEEPGHGHETPAKEPQP